MVRTYHYKRPRIKFTDLDDWDLLRRPIVVSECPQHHRDELYTDRRLDYSIPSPSTDYSTSRVREYKYTSEVTSSDSPTYEYRSETSRTSSGPRVYPYSTASTYVPRYYSIPTSTTTVSTTRLGPSGVTTRTYRY